MPQSLSKIIVHIIFSTKDRYPFLEDTDIRKTMFAYLANAFKNRNAQTFIVGGAVDHVHILCLYPKDELISKTIGEIKRVSSKWIKNENLNIPMLSKFSWQRGYGVFSVSQSNVPEVRKYIESQEEHHRQISFQDEYRKFLQKYQIQFDEKYVWD